MLMYGSQWGSLAAARSYKKAYFLLQVTWESVSVLQVTRESISGTTSHMRGVGTCNEIEGSYDKIIISIVPSYTGKKYHSLVALALLLVIFSGIDLYYGDTYIVNNGTRWLPMVWQRTCQFT